MVRLCNNVLCRVSMATGFLMLAACGTSYHVSHVPDLKSEESKWGLYYYLPKTRVHVEALVSGKSIAYGPYFSGDTKLKKPAVYDGQEFNTFAMVYAHNVGACKEGSELQFLSLESEHIPDPEWKYEFAAVSVSTETVPDPDHLYRLDIEPSSLASFSHTINYLTRHHSRCCATVKMP